MLIAKTPLTVPTMWEQGEWDQEDMYGGDHAYRAWEPKDTNEPMNYLVMGPWFHSRSTAGARTGAVRVGDRHVGVFSPGFAGAVLQSVSEAGVSEGGAAGADV